MPYNPANVPRDPAALPDFLRAEFQRIAQEWNAANALLRLSQVNAAPDKPRRGDIRLPDGSDWDPCSQGLAPVWFDGTQWQPFGSGGVSSIYDVACYIAGEPTASETVLQFVAVRAFTLPAGFSGSEAFAQVAATASTVFSVRKNGASIGSVTFAASADTATFSAASATSFAAGDVLNVVAPATPDATLSDISITFLGSAG